MKIRTKPIPRPMALALTLLMILTMFPTAAFAAKVPTPSSGSYFTCYTLQSSGKVYAYTSSKLTVKTGGYISCSTDECKILAVEGNAVYVRYPVSGGTRTAWFPLSAFTQANLSNVQTATATAKITTYRRPNGATFGSVSANDKVYILGTSGSYTQLLYPIGANNWKLGFISTSNANRYLKTSGSTSTGTSSSTPSSILPAGTYVMVPKCAPNSAVEVSNSSLGNGASVQCWSRAFDKNGKIIPTMTVRVEVVGKNEVILYNGNSGKAYDIEGPSKAINAICHQWDLPASEKYTRKSTTWQVKDAGDGALTLINKNSGLALDVSGASSANGTRLVQYTPNNTSAQAFTFYPVNYFDKSSSTSNILSTVGTSMSTALYGGSGGRLTCNFDGYSGSNRHEGIDFAKSSGANVYSLTAGRVTRVEEKNPKTGLSTIAIYDSSTNKTVIYLHTNPNDNLYVGKQIARGELIATESDRGTPGVYHTHVEVRSGEKTSAAVSSNTVLENSNPTSFWNSQGYQVK